MANINPILPPLTERSGILRWLRKNLFGSWLDAILTVLGALVVYWAVSGEGEIEIEGNRHPLTPDSMVRVAPGVSRKVRTGDSPMRLLVVGGVPGGVYEPSANGKLGAPDPMAA